MNVPRVAVRLYRLLLRVYPGEFTDTFGDEMLGVFLAGARHSSAEGRLGSFLLRELADAPRGLLRAHWHDWRRRVQGWTILSSGSTEFQHTSRRLSMLSFIRHPRVWRIVLLATLALALSGPWFYDQIHVPAEFPCNAPNVRLEGDFCGMPIPGTWFFAGFIGAATQAVAAAFTDGFEPFSLVFLFALVLLALPIPSTLLLVLRRRGGRLRGLHLVALVFSGLVLTVSGLNLGARAWPDLWGYWLYTGALIALLALEVLVLRTRRDQTRT